MIVTKLCNDERFLNLPVKKAYFHDAEDEEQYLYIIKNKKCCGCGKSHYFAVVDTGKHFQLETLTELPVSIKTVVAPSTIREVIEKYL